MLTIRQIEAMLAEPDRPITITSGEGVLGSTEAYRGKRTLRAIRARLTRERCHGDRWARAQVYSHESQYGDDVWVDIESGDYDVRVRWPY